MKKWFYYATSTSVGLHSSGGVIDIIPLLEVGQTGGGGTTVIIAGADSAPENAGLGRGVLHDVPLAPIDGLGLGAR